LKGKKRESRLLSEKALRENEKHLSLCRDREDGAEGRRYKGLRRMDHIWQPIRCRKQRNERIQRQFLVFRLGIW
jgi:hypothetical protein